MIEMINQFGNKFKCPESEVQMWLERKAKVVNQPKAESKPKPTKKK
jgi:hypothetical protein